MLPSKKIILKIVIVANKLTAKAVKIRACFKNLFSKNSETKVFITTTEREKAAGTIRARVDDSCSSPSGKP